jgi:hypothetical protein
MLRQRILQVVLALVGLLFLVGAYPVLEWRSELACEAMLGCVYAVLGVFLLLAVRNPSAHRSLISFTAWSSLAHGLLMGAQSLTGVIPHHDFSVAVPPFLIIGIVLLAFFPAKPKQQADAAAVLATN